MKTKFEYGEIYTVAPTYGIDVPRSQIQIIGIVNVEALPDWMDVAVWEIGDPEFDFQLNNEPWYLFEILDGAEEGNITGLPEFALQEVSDQDYKEKLEKWRNNRLIGVAR